MVAGACVSDSLLSLMLNCRLKVIIYRFCEGRVRYHKISDSLAGGRQLELIAETGYVGSPVLPGSLPEIT